jgi:hypothetical protein
MPKLKKKWSEIEESAGGFSDIEPGAYVLVITGYDVNEHQQFVSMKWDVAEGPAKGTYAKSQYPPADVLSWKETAYNMLKHKLHVLAESNAGFQPTVAFENDQWGEFVGKRFYAVVRRRLYTAGPNSKTPGADRTAIEVARWLMPEEFEEHDWPESLTKDRDQRDKSAQQQAQAPVMAPPAQQVAMYDEDVPF